MDLRRWLTAGADAIDAWQATFGPFERHRSLRIGDDQFAGAFTAFTERLRENYPFFHPSYAGQMLKPPHPAAVVGYLTAMLVNPNNHALDGGPATARMEKEAVAQLAGLDEAPWRAIAECDSVVVDPHKHGLQPYGCGAVLFRDPGVGRFYLHDSPYTYFTSGELHLGEISLECSRAGAAAAALWLTFRLLPPTPDGLGQVLAACRRAALHWAELISDSERLCLYQPPELDIVSYFPAARARSLSAIDQASARMLAEGMADPAHPVYLSTLRVAASGFARRHPGFDTDRDDARILRSVLMKPEDETYVRELHSRVEQLAARRSAL